MQIIPQVIAPLEMLATITIFATAIVLKAKKNATKRSIMPCKLLVGDAQGVRNFTDEEGIVSCEDVSDGLIGTHGRLMEVLGAERTETVKNKTVDALFAHNIVEAMTTFTTQALFYGIILLALLSVFPYNLRNGWGSYSLLIPILGILFVLSYEMLIRASLRPESVPIRLDLVIVVPLSIFIVLTGAVRCFLVWHYQKHHKSSDGRIAQAIVIGALCVIVTIIFFAIW